MIFFHILSKLIKVELNFTFVSLLCVMNEFLQSTQFDLYYVLLLYMYVRFKNFASSIKHSVTD